MNTYICIHMLICIHINIITVIYVYTHTYTHTPEIIQKIRKTKKLLKENKK